MSDTLYLINHDSLLIGSIVHWFMCLTHLAVALLLLVASL